MQRTAKSFRLCVFFSETGANCIQFCCDRYLNWKLKIQQKLTKNKNIKQTEGANISVHNFTTGIDDKTKRKEKKNAIFQMHTHKISRNMNWHQIDEYKCMRHRTKLLYSLSYLLRLHFDFLIFIAYEMNHCIVRFVCFLSCFGATLKMCEWKVCRWRHVGLTPDVCSTNQAISSSWIDHECMSNVICQCCCKQPMQQHIF